MLANILSAHAGQHWSEIPLAIAEQITSLRPTLIVEAALARIEVFAPIRPPGGGLPIFLKSSEDIPASPVLPEYASPVAIFYPTTG
jgi:hypothetical protein